MSLPPRERGLKLQSAVKFRLIAAVAPSAGAWIEISGHGTPDRREEVAPSAGAWIEILTCPTCGQLLPEGRSLRGSVD